VLLNTGGVPYNIIVADDKSDDETRNILAHVSGIRVVRNEKNLGFLRTCNRVSKHAAGKYLLFLNNDTNVQKGWLNSLFETMEYDERIGIVGAKLLFPDGRLQEAGGIVWSDGACWMYGRGDDPDRPEYNTLRETDYISGACLMIRKELWKKINGFDEQYAPAYYEDTDLAFAVRGLGYKVVYQPRSIVVHFEGASSGTDERSGIKHYQRINREKFFRKWERILKAEYPEPGVIRVKRP
jgi:GT2 family glycosyltransferase